MNLYIIATISGLTVGSIYALVAVGYTIVFNATRVFNLAQGDLVMVSVMVSHHLLNHRAWPMAWAALGAIGATITVALVEERVAVRRFLTRSSGPGFGWLIAVLGVSLLLESSVVSWLGNARQPIPSPFDRLAGGSTTARVPRAVVLGGNIVVEYRRVFVIAVVALTVAALAWFFARTWLGQAMRAVSEDRDAARLLGVRPEVTGRAAFALAGAVAGIAGVVVAPITGSDPTIGLAFTLKGFVAIAIGGFGTVRGAMAGGLVLGVAEQLWNLLYPGGVGPNYQVLVALVLLLGVLAVRPEGLFKGPRPRTV